MILLNNKKTPSRDNHFNQMNFYLSVIKLIDDSFNTLVEKLFIALEKAAVNTEKTIQTQLINMKILQKNYDLDILVEDYTILQSSNDSICIRSTNILISIDKNLIKVKESLGENSSMEMITFSIRE